MNLCEPDARHLAALYGWAAEVYGPLPAFATREGAGRWRPLSFEALYARGSALAAALVERGVLAREAVGVFSDNRVEWMVADYGIQLCGAVNTPRGTDVTDEELIHIVNHSGMHVAFVEHGRMAKRLENLRGRLPELREVAVLAPGEPPEGCLGLEGLLREGEELLEREPTRLEARMAEIGPEDLFTLIYTSGTTGTPKGVMLTHANILSQLENVPLELSCTDRVLSILPVWHIFERMFELLAIRRGICTYYTSIRTFGDDLLEVEPTFMGSAPRLWESLHHRILQGVKRAHPVRRGLFHIAYFLGKRYRASLFYLRDQDEWLEPPRPFCRFIGKVFHGVRWVLLLPWYGFFNAAVLESVRRKAGGSLKGTISGGGALPREIDTFFNAIGIPVLEGYGLTETTPVVAVRTPAQPVCGTVGPLIPGTEVRIVDPEKGETLYPDPSRADRGRGRRGEILVRGPQVMKGYSRDPELTRRVLSEEGWFHTGDLGMMTHNDTLKILGRRKATIVLSNGENVEPDPIENRLRQSELIEYCMVLGQDEKHVSLLVSPDVEGFARAGLRHEGMASLAADPEALRRLREEAHRLLSDPGAFRRYEQIHDVRMVSEPFEVGRELTNLFKLRRHVVRETHAALIRELYPHPGGTR